MKTWGWMLACLVVVGGGSVGYCQSNPVEFYATHPIFQPTTPVDSRAAETPAATVTRATYETAQPVLGPPTSLAPVTANYAPATYVASNHAAGSFTSCSFPAQTACQPVQCFQPVTSCFNPGATVAPSLVQPGCCPPPCSPPVCSQPVTNFQPLVALRPAPCEVYVGRGLLGQPKAYVPGEPVRNFFRYILP